MLEGELDGIRAAGTWKAERIITSMQGPQINVDGSRGSEWSRCVVTPVDLGGYEPGDFVLKRTILIHF